MCVCVCVCVCVCKVSRSGGVRVVKLVSEIVVARSLVLTGLLLPAGRGCWAAVRILPGGQGKIGPLLSINESKKQTNKSTEKRPSN